MGRRGCAAGPSSSCGRAGSDIDNRRRASHLAVMIRSAGQYSFWYFGYPTPLAPAEDRSAKE
jgi:hypothetical protein